MGVLGKIFKMRIRFFVYLMFAAFCIDKLTGLGLPKFGAELFFIIQYFAILLLRMVIKMKR